LSLDNYKQRAVKAINAYYREDWVACQESIVAIVKSDLEDDKEDAQALGADSPEVEQALAELEAYLPEFEAYLPVMEGGAVDDLAEQRLRELFRRQEKVSCVLLPYRTREVSVAP
jgi:hypothetical protein